MFAISHPLDHITHHIMHAEGIGLLHAGHGRVLRAVVAIGDQHVEAMVALGGTLKRRSFMLA